MTDIVLNFWTGVITEDNVVLLDLKTIRRSYVKRWLAFDILSVVPLDYVALIVIETRSGSSTLLHASTALRFLRLFKLLSLIRLFRVVKLMHYLAKWEEVNNKAMQPINESSIKRVKIVMTVVVVKRLKIVMTVVAKGLKTVE